MSSHRNLTLELEKAVAFAQDSKHDARERFISGELSLDEFAYVACAADRVRQIAASGMQPMEAP